MLTPTCWFTVLHLGRLGRFAVGQNIARSWTTRPPGPYDSEPNWRRQISGWFNEVQNYDASYSRTTGHYTQVRNFPLVYLRIMNDSLETLRPTTTSLVILILSFTARLGWHFSSRLWLLLLLRSCSRLHQELRVQLRTQVSSIFF